MSNDLFENIAMTTFERDMLLELCCYLIKELKLHGESCLKISEEEFLNHETSGFKTVYKKIKEKILSTDDEVIAIDLDRMLEVLVM